MKELLSKIHLAANIATFTIKHVMHARHAFAGTPVYDALIRAESACLALQDACVNEEKKN